MATLLLELFSEEIPSRMQRGSAEQLQRLVNGGLEKAGLESKEIKTFVSPRHLAIQVFGLPDAQPDVTEEKKGPKVDAPAQALNGFFKSAGIPQEQCEVREINGAKHYFAVIHRKGRPTAKVAKEMVEEALRAFVWPKSMCWGAHALQWVRPLHGVVCLFDKTIVPVQFGHLTAGNVTAGHRFLSPDPIRLSSAEDYVGALEKAHVLVERDARREKIKTEVAALAAKHSLSVVADEALLDEVTGLVEWPVALLGTFDKSFLDLPPEVLISEMKVHQRYFALTDTAGKLSNSFIAVANTTTKDDGKSIAGGNARVLRARLSDGAFYWEQDRKKHLMDWAKGLRDMVFHAKVGMMSAKVKRIEYLAREITLKLNEQGVKADVHDAVRAAQLCKADLMTGMVGEFPELQGIMGRYYALNSAAGQIEKPEIADAIRDHYKPLGPNDSLPTNELGAIIAIADKLDSIASLFAAGEKPTGSKDPFALRRAALGVLRIVQEKGFMLDLEAFIDNKAVVSEIADFFRDRLKNLLRDNGVRHDIIDATFAAGDSGFMPILIMRRADELAAWLKTSPGVDALAAIKRPLNILAAEEKKAKLSYSFIDSKLTALSEPTEKDLLKALKGTKAAKPADLNALTAPINSFFDKVLVNDEDAAVREARLSLLAGVRDAANQIADFSKIEG